MSAAVKPVLYSYFRSTASWRVRIALAYKEIEYEYKAVHLVKGEQKSDVYRIKNPMGQVPCLLIDGHTLTQSLAIIEYLEETRPGKHLLPKDPADRAQARRIAEIINSGIQPIQNLIVLNRLAEITTDPDIKVKWANEWIMRGFEGLEPNLKKTAGTFCMGHLVTLADLALVPQVRNATERFNVDMSLFPTIARVNDACEHHPAFIAADPFNQPDCPEELKNK